MLQELTPQYVPREILHREDQLKIIKRVFTNFKENGMGSNLLILGVTGSGKTVVVENILKNHNNAIYGSASIYKTTFRTLKGLFDIKTNTQGTLLAKIIQRLKSNPKIIIIDEINKLADPTNLFNDLNTIYRETSCPIILVSNNRNVFNLMPDDARLTLFFERVEFPPYDAIKLYDIIKQRLDLLRSKIGEIPEGQLRKICALVSKDSSARNLLIITYRCVMANNFSDSYIDKVIRDLHQQDWIDFARNMRPSHREFLNILMDLQTCQKQIKPSDISVQMKDFTPSRISQLISFFEENGIIQTNYKNMGRAGGRLRVIQFVSEDVFDKMEELLKQVV